MANKPQSRINRTVEKIVVDHSLLEVLNPEKLGSVCNYKETNYKILLGEFNKELEDLTEEDLEKVIYDGVVEASVVPENEDNEIPEEHMTFSVNVSESASTAIKTAKSVTIYIKTVGNDGADDYESEWSSPFNLEYEFIWETPKLGKPNVLSARFVIVD